jgi:hypothetical protein
MDRHTAVSNKLAYANTNTHMDRDKYCFGEPFGHTNQNFVMDSITYRNRNSNANMDTDSNTNTDKNYNTNSNKDKHSKL